VSEYHLRSLCVGMTMLTSVLSMGSNGRSLRASAQAR
jgi:hypothetical protein